MLDVLIRNGKIVDGSGVPGFYGDVAVKAGKIVKIAPVIAEPAVQTIDATGLVVAPGFIDCHNHSDKNIFANHSAYNALEQGVTTLVAGQCGTSAAPYFPGLLGKLSDDERDAVMLQRKDMCSCLAAIDQLDLGANMAFFVGHNNLRGKAMGFAADVPTRDQMKSMQLDLIEAMEAGCLGFSTGLIYAPSAHATTEELIELARAMVPYGGIYVSHIRGEDHRVLGALDEAISIGREAGVQVHISHLKVMGLQNAGLAEQLLQRIDKANEEGIVVYADQYPYEASSSSLSSRIPAKFHDGGKAKLLERIADQQIRRQIDEYGLDYDTMYITSLPQTPDYVRKFVGQIAREENRAPVDVLCDILLANKGQGSGIYFNQNAQDLMKIMAHPRVFGGSDSSNFPQQRPDVDAYATSHPRGQGCMVRRLAMQRDHKLCSLETAVHRVTGAPAQALHLSGQGLLREGLDANITVFNYAALRDHATYQQPYRANEGIIHVLVNGEIAVMHSKATGTTAGKVLRV